MSGPLTGVRVLEVAMYGFVPSCGAVLGEWGAEVVKVEHAVTGDPQRGLRQTGPLRVEGDPNPNIEHANRGKRAIGLESTLASRLHCKVAMRGSVVVLAITACGTACGIERVPPPG